MLRVVPPSVHATGALAVRVCAVTVAVFTVARLAVACSLETTGWAHDPAGMLEALAAGAIADTGAALVMAAAVYPLVALTGRRGLRASGHLLLALGMVILVFGAAADWVFWREFASRLNGIAVFYLMFPREVIGNLHESFDLALWLPPVVVLGTALWWALRTSVAGALHAPRRFGGWLAGWSACSAAGVALIAVAPHGFSANREINELALNGPVNMVSAALSNDAQYDGVYPGIDESTAVAVLRDAVRQDNTAFLDPPSMRSIRRWVDNGDRPKRLNVVLVLEESLGSRFVDVLDNTLPQHITPRLDELSSRSLFFTNVYASGQRTVRGLEATLTGFTPIPGISTARRPGAEGMHSLPAVLKRFGYETAMLYGGRALFDNMGTFWEGIGFDHVWDQGDLAHSSFSTAWGVSDEDLFAEALDRLDEHAGHGRPFLLTMLTVSNHRPYTFPEDHLQRDAALGNRENTSRYADFAFGDFLDRARTHPWFDDTVFVLVADHGHRVNGAAQVPLHRYRIPMLMYSPRHIEPRRVDVLSAQIDLIPTLLGQLGMSYESSFFGLDLMRVRPGGGRIAVAHNFSIAYAVPGHAVVLNPDGSEAGYRFEPGREALDAERPDPRTSRLARAVTQTAHRMFYAGEYRERPGAGMLGVVRNGAGAGAASHL